NNRWRSRARRRDRRRSAHGRCQENRRTPHAGSALRKSLAHPTQELACLCDPRRLFGERSEAGEVVGGALSSQQTLCDRRNVLRGWGLWVSNDVGYSLTDALHGSLVVAHKSTEADFSADERRANF